MLSPLCTTFAFILCLTYFVGFSVQVNCPPTDPDDPIYLPHETDCGKYYECSGGNSFLFDCPPGTYFNVAKSVCDRLSNCNCGNLRTSTATPQQEFGIFEVQCPTDSSDFPVYLPHETDCNKFYECDHGKAILQKCPDGLYFNPKLNVCDKPKNVDCNNNYVL